MNVMKMNNEGSMYIDDFQCTCGSPTYCYYCRSMNIFYKIIEYVVCGGCEKTWFRDDIPKFFEMIDEKIEGLCKET